MTGFRPTRSFLLATLLVSFSLLSCLAFGQLPYLDQEVRVQGLPSLMAVADDPRTVLLTSLDTIIHDREVCCGKNSALDDSLVSVDPASLKDMASKLDGKHLLSDGRPIQVKTEYVAGKETSGGHLIQMLHEQHAALMQWNSHLYVVHTALYFWQSDGQGGTYAQLHKLLLWDTRYSDARRLVTFTTGIDDPSKIDGLLFVEASRP